MISFKNLRSEINEAFTPKEIKMAIGVASDPRYKGGNYSGAVRAIEKIKKGLANHPQVAAVLKRQNEDKFEPHMMYDPKTGKGYKANTMDDHLRMKELGYTHDKISEDGHRDVKSAMNQVKIAVSALNKMNTELGKLNAEDPLPTWWTNKVAIAVDKLDSMADYLDTQVEDKISEAAKVVAKIWYGPNNKTKSKSFPDEGKALAWVKKMQDIEDVSDYSLR